MTSQEQYWDKKIREWTQISYGKKIQKVSLLEKLANFFRGSITGRLDVAVNRIGPLAGNKIILDLGCGLGDFCFRILPYQPKKVIGIDISSVAIKGAKKLAKIKRVGGEVEFIKKNAVRMKKLPRFDIAAGLGFIDYLNEREMKDLFRLISGSNFFFSVFEKKLSLKNLIHAVYTKTQNCPGAFKYSRRELIKMIPKSLEPYFTEESGMLFVTNLPKY